MLYRVNGVQSSHDALRLEGMAANPETPQDERNARLLDVINELGSEYELLFLEKGVRYSRYCYRRGGQDGRIAVKQFYLTLVQSAGEAEWYGAPAHEANLELEYPPLPEEVHAVDVPFEYVPLHTPEALIDFIYEQSGAVDKLITDA